MHPQKLDLRKTKEFKKWKQTVRDTNNPEANIIVQTLYTTETTNNEENQSDTEMSINNKENQDDTESDTESINNNTNEESQSETDESEYRGNMLLQIPLQNYLPPGKQNKNTQTTPTNTEPPINYDFEIPTNNNIEPFSDERLREIVAELRENPELQNLFADPENLEQEDEGVELRTLEEEFELDIEPFDYRLEVELSNWDSQV